jgi:hypothetical protein
VTLVKKLPRVLCITNSQSKSCNRIDLKFLLLSLQNLSSQITTEQSLSLKLLNKVIPVTIKGVVRNLHLRKRKRAL